MIPEPLIGQNVCYWARNASKPLPALVADFDEEKGTTTLVIFTPSGGRFVKEGLAWKNYPGVEGWSEVGQTVR